MQNMACYRFAVGPLLLVSRLSSNLVVCNARPQFDIKFCTIFWMTSGHHKSESCKIRRELEIWGNRANGRKHKVATMSDDDAWQRSDNGSACTNHMIGIVSRCRKNGRMATWRRIITSATCYASRLHITFTSFYGIFGAYPRRDNDDVNL